MQEIFAKATHGLKIIMIFIVLIAVLSILARLIVRNKLKNTNKSKQTKKVFEDLTALLVTGILGIIMILVLANLK